MEFQQISIPVNFLGKCFLFKTNAFLLRTEIEADCLQSDSKNQQSKSVKRMRHVELSNQLPGP